MKIAIHNLVVYKNKPAIVHDVGEKILIKLNNGDELKVRERDIEFLHSELNDLKTLDIDFALDDKNIFDVWDLCIAEYGIGASITIQELSELLFNENTALSAWKTFCIAQDDLYFSKTNDALKIKSEDEVKTETAKRSAKKNEGRERDEFLQRITSGKIYTDEESKKRDERFLQDVQALSFGKTDKSRTMRDLGLSEDPVAAHKLLLDSGFWDFSINPYPARYSVDTRSATTALMKMKDGENRIDLTHLESFAVDNSDSTDPDDAVSLTNENGASVLYVHISDPASSILSGSDADREAMDRGATLYAPDGLSRMLCDEALEIFALGLNEKSLSLTFKIILNDDNSIRDTEIFTSFVHVTRLTYEEADTYADFAKFFKLMEKNIQRRKSNGAVFIEFPEVKVFVKDGVPDLVPIKNCASQKAVQECMLLAGEAAAMWALKKGISFPYIGQQVENLQKEFLEGLAGSYQARKCMGKRSLTLQPAKHQGLGLDLYTQVTSPLRRYTDLLCHQQIRSVLLGEKPQDADSLAVRLSVGERAALNTVRAERESKKFYLCVYLYDKIDTIWDAVVMDIRGPHAIVFITDLGIETQVAIGKNQKVDFNLIVQIKLRNVKIAENEIIFIMD
ncbi:MAG: ribonuclease catalytic domain-containing protein [Termitinemataceae bacterium]|nr:MAG: ribonuclease catalytic domain-containing protein [Termitinemataceae bacterium]